jgi:hypothetical protein
MLIDSSNNPDKSLYVLWAELISLMKKIKKAEKIVSIDILYSMFIDMKWDFNVTIDYFVYILDWLYIIWLIDFIDSDNNIKICF